MGRKTLVACASAIAGSAWSSRRIAVASIAGSWGLYLAFVALRTTIDAFPREFLLLQWHFLIALAGCALTWLLHLMLRRLETGSIVARIAAALTLSIPAAIIMALVNYYILFLLAPIKLWAPEFLARINLRGVFSHTIQMYYLVIAGWATLNTSVSSAVESQDAQRRAAVWQAESREAEIRALRHQLNPHFLFNALNTISALVMDGDIDGAEKAIQALSLFLRSTLETELVEDVTLAEELELQRLYLDIQRIRFGHRLQVRVLIPAELSVARLPPLLLQPLIENVIHHAVAPSSERVTMTIAATGMTDGLHLVIEDDGRGGLVAPGVGIGLRNAASRLTARYGDAGRCEFGPRAGGGFRVELVVPQHPPAARV